MAFPGRRFMNIFTLLLAMWNSAFLNSTVRYRESFLQALYRHNYVKKKNHTPQMLNYRSIRHTELAHRKQYGPPLCASQSVTDWNSPVNGPESQAGCRRSCRLFVGSSWLWWKKAGSSLAVGTLWEWCQSCWHKGEKGLWSPGSHRTGQLRSRVCMWRREGWAVRHLLTSPTHQGHSPLASG